MGEDDDHLLFSEAMGTVRPLPTVDKAHAQKRLPRGYEIIGKRNREIVTAPAETGLSFQGTNQPWIRVADGISRERLKRLGAGQPPASRTIDLHGITRDAALATLALHFAEAFDTDSRVLCIIHGRGLHSSDGRPVLKEAVYHWLSEGPFAGHILAVIPQPGSGGGACLVLLRRH
ncbi:MAG: Smr/MutS family protein [Mariprofundus sp.]